MGVGKMTGPKKAAILLLALGEEGAADIIKNLEDSEIQQVGYYMARFTDVSPEELDVVLEEYYNKSISDSGGFMTPAGAPGRSLTSPGVRLEWDHPTTTLIGGSIWARENFAVTPGASAARSRRRPTSSMGFP